MKSEHYYSVIVPSFNRQGEIGELLASFEQMDFPKERFELLIADDGSTDGTAAWVEKYRQRSELDIKVLVQINQGPGAARNMGMENARGDFFVFIDSDCTVSSGWLSAIDRALSTQAGDAFGGPDGYRDDFPDLVKAINYSMTSFLSTGGIRGHRKKALGKYYPRSFNMGLSRAVYDQIGGFGALRHGQDIEYSHRIIKSGAKVLLVPDAIVYHKRRTSLKKFFRQVFNWGVARINLYKIAPEMLEWVHALPALLTLTGVVMLLAGFLSAAWRPVLLGGGAAAALLFGSAAVQAVWKYRCLKQLYLVPVVMAIQITGYGIGFLSAFVMRVVLKQDEFVGFQKRYYR